MKRTLVSLLLAFSATAALQATPADSAEVKHHFGADIRGGYAFSSSGTDLDVSWYRPTEYHTAASLHLKYAFSYGESTRTGRMYPGAYQGVGLGVNAFCTSHEAMLPVSVYLFQGAPIKRFSRRFSLGYEWNFGASFGWHKSSYDRDFESNLIVGSKVNAVINLGLLLDYKLTSSLTLRGGIEGTHFSNGNTSLPNPGVNTLGLRLGVVYTPGQDSFASDKKGVESEDFDASVRGMGYDLLLYGAWRKAIIENGDDKYPVPGHFGVAGISFAPMWQFNRYIRAGLSADIQYDESSNLGAHKVEDTSYDDPKFYRQPFHECLMGGVSARAELVMPVFSINVGLGRNLVAVKVNRHFYQTMNLKLRLPARFWLNIGYRLHDFHRPDNLIFGLGYTFR